MSLNIAGVSSKVESLHFFKLVKEVDVLFLSEIKCVYPFTVQGFRCIRSSVISGEEAHGGVAVLVRHYLWNDVCSVQKYKDLISFMLRGLCFIAMYLPWSPDSTLPAVLRSSMISARSTQVR